MKFKIVKKSKHIYLHGMLTNYDDFKIFKFLVDKGETLIAKSRRKNKIGEKIEVIFTKFKIKVENISIEDYYVNIGGEILESSDPNIPLHKHQNIKLKLGSRFTLIKEKILNAQIELLKKSSTYKEIILIAYDVDSLLVYKLTPLSRKKIYEDSFSDKEERYPKLLEDIKKFYIEGKTVICGNPVFNSELKQEIKAKYVTVPDAESAIHFLLKSGILKSIFETIEAEQQSYIDDFLRGIGKGWIYGEKIKENLDRIILSLSTYRAFQEDRQLIEELDKRELHFIISDEGEEIINSFGGIVAKVS